MTGIIINNNGYNKRNGSFSVSGGTPGVVTMRKIG